MGYNRSHFNPTNHMREARDEHTPHMPASCYNLLGKIIGKTTGDVARHESGSNLNAGDDGNFDIQMQERFVTKLARNRDANGPTHRQALDHIRAENYLAPAQVSIRDMPLTDQKRSDGTSQRHEPVPRLKQRQLKRSAHLRNQSVHLRNQNGNLQNHEMIPDEINAEDSRQTITVATI